MYCRKCGKQIDYEAELCKECQEMETFFSDPAIEPQFEVKEQPQYTQQPVQPLPGNKKEGFGKALAATILGSIAYFIASVALGMLMGLQDVANDYYYTYDKAAYDAVQAVSIVFAVIALGLAIPALILGIKSMSCFFKQKREGKVKPIATLVLGIVGVATSAFGLFFASLCFLM